MSYIGTVPIPQKIPYRQPHGMGASTSATVYSTVGSALGAASLIPGVGAIAAIGEGVTALLAAIGIGKGCGNTCIQATQYANQAGTLLTQNLNTYMGLATPRAQSAQTAALANFDQIWQGLVTACSNPSLGSAGQKCISDRQQGSCAYKVANGGGWQQQNGTWTFVPYGANGSGPACWNWYIGLRDPIANDPFVVPDVQAAGAGTSSGASSLVSSLTSGGSMMPLALLAGAGLLLWWAMK